MTPSVFQQKIYDTFQNTKHNINIQAVAGSGKTTTLLELVKLVPRRQSTLFLAFNKSIVQELKERNPRPDVDISTIHSCGWRSIMMKYGREAELVVTKAYIKAKKMLDGDEFKKLDKKRKPYILHGLSKLMDMMRCNLSDNSKESINEILLKYDIDVDGVEIRHIQKLFTEMVNDRKKFDFMDMIYIPVVDRSIYVKQYDNVFCDESQDFSAAQQQFIARCIKKGGRLVSVGDRKQSIYGFAGADSNSYDNMANVNGYSEELPLSVCYRCAKSIVELAKNIVPYIESAPNAPDGTCSYGTLQDIRDGDWVICRNVKPLVEIYIWLMGNKIKSHVKGKDIGEGIIRLISKTKAKTLDALFDGLQDEVEHLVNDLIARGVQKPRQHPKYETLAHKIDVINVLSSEVERVSELIDMINDIFQDESKEGITLCTIHKSKGLENERVYLVCPELIPSRFASQPWELEQEQNLLYVAYTRAKRELYIVPTATYENDIISRITI